MKSAHVIEIYVGLKKQDVQIWVDGGWGVDALLGMQTRPHSDLDIAIDWKDVSKLREYLSNIEYREVRADNQWNFVLKDNNGSEIDVHAFVKDSKGNIVDGIKYPIDSLSGKGVIDGIKVMCISPEWMVKFHSGYELKDKDFRDVSALCRKFNIELPEEYRKFTNS